MSIFDFPEYLPEQESIPEVPKATDGNHVTLTYAEFQEHCRHTGWYKRIEELDRAVKMCSFANRQDAKCWDDWIICSEENCPLLKGAEHE